MLNQKIFSLILGLLVSSNSMAQTFDWYMTQSASGKLDQATAQEILKELQAGDSQNVAVVEYLLKIAKEPLDYNFLLNGVLNDKLQYLYKILYELAGKSAKPLEYIISQTGFSEPDIRQRLLNNVALLERLLAILGQGYNENIKSQLYDKQVILKNFGSTNNFLKILLEGGYNLDQLLLFIQNSHEQTPIHIEHHYGPVMPVDSAFSQKSNGYEPAPYDIDEISEELKSAPGTFFSAAEYEDLMSLVAEKDYSVYQALRTCQFKLHGPCIKKNTESGLKYFKIEAPLNETIVIMSQQLFDMPYINFIKDYSLITKAQYGNFINLVMHIIRLIAPILYEKIIKIDPTGQQTVYWDNKEYSMGAMSVNHFGYPMVMVGSDFLNLSLNEQKFVIGHELGHYAKVHVLNRTLIRPRIKNQMESKNLKEMFVNAYTRVQEYEADRFSIVNIGNNYLWGLEFLKLPILGGLQRNLNNLRKTHPKNISRIEHLEDLGRDLALGRIKVEPLSEADWDRIIAKHRANLGLGI